MNKESENPATKANETVSQATLDGAFLLAYHDARDNSNRVMNREDFRKGWNQCLIAFGMTMQVGEKVWDKYMGTAQLASKGVKRK